MQVEGTADVLRNWEAIKAGERAASGEEDAHRSRLDGVPAILPSLARAQVLGDRAARTGFDWPDLEGVLAKVAEEVAELQAVEDRQARAWELGDLLFTLTNVARWLEVDAESALRDTCDRFVERYARMEQAARARGLDLASLPLEEQDSFWEEVKHRR